MKTKSSTILKKMRKLLAKGWCQQNYAVNKEGFSVEPVLNTNAVRFCPRGAYTKVHEEQCPYIYDEALTYIEKIIKRDSIEKWNDCKCRTQEQVLTTMDSAIALALENGD